MFVLPKKRENIQMNYLSNCSINIFNLLNTYNK